MSLFNRLIINAVSIYSARLLEGIIELAVVAFILSKMDSKCYGAALLIISIQSMIDIARAGMGKATFKYIAEYNAKGDYVASQTVLATSFVMQGGVGLLGLLVCLVIAPYISSIFALPRYMGADAHLATILIGFGIAITFALSPWRHVIIAHERYDLFALTRAGNKVVRAILIVVFFLLYTPSFISLVLATILGNIFQHVICIPIARKLESRLLFGLKNISLQAGKLIFRFSCFDMLHTFSALLFNHGALFVAAHMISLNAVAGLGIIRNITSLVGIVISQVTGILVPATSRLEAVGERDKLLKLVVHGTTVSVFAGGAVITGLIPCMDSLLSVWLGDSYSYLASVAILLLSAEILTASVSCIHTTLAGTGRVVVDGTSNLFCTALGLIIGIAIIYYMDLGLTGLVIGLFCARLFRFVFITGYGTEVLGLSLGKFILVGYLRTYLLAALVIAGAMIVKLSASSWLTLLLGAVTTAAIFVLPGLFWIIDHEDMLKLKYAIYGAVGYICNKTV